MNTFLRRTALALSILLPVLACFFFAAPLIVDSYILPGLLRSSGPLKKQASLSRLSPFSVQGFLRLEENSDPVLSIPFIQIRFSPGRLLKKRISSIRMDHATVHLYKEDGSYALRGFSAPEPKTEANSPLSSPLLVPFAADRLILKECSLVLHQEGLPEKRLNLFADLSLEFSTDESNGYRLESVAGSFSLSELATAHGTIAISFKNHLIEAELALEADRLPIDILPLPESLLLEPGKMTTRIRCELNPEDPARARFEVTGNIGGLQLERIAGTHIQQRLATAESEFSVSGTPENLTYAIGPVAVISPVAAKLQVSGTGSLSPSELSTRGELKMAFPSLGSPTTSPIKIESKYQASYLKERGWRVEIDADSSQDTEIRAGTMRIKASPVKMRAELNGQDSISGTLQASAAQVSLIEQGEEVHFLNGSLSSTLIYDQQGTTARLAASVPRVSLPSKELELENLSLDIPVASPFNQESAAKQGSIAAGGVYLKKVLLASASGTVVQTGKTWECDGSLHSQFLQGSECGFTAQAAPLEHTGSLEWNLEKAEIASERLPAFVTIPEKIGFTGLLSSRGMVLLQKNGLTGNAAWLLEDGEVEIDGDKGEIQGINCSVEMDRLPEVNSRPSQRCSADSVRFGNMHFNDVWADFRIDGPETIFIEKSRAGWCRGTLESTSLGLSLTDKKIETVFYCSRINFSDLLNQFGLDQAEGEGSVNGKLPVSFSRSGLKFDDGFLFSTPGLGGIVKFSDTALLRQGIGTVDAGGYLEYSMEAMEDFSYNWTKLSFNSVGEELLLTMQLDGKPRSPLPYRFKDGKIITTPEGDGMQYPIRLDVNFRLPLDDLFRVGQNIQTIRENM